MDTKQNTPSDRNNNSGQSSDQKNDLTIAANDNPRANANIKQAPFEQKNENTNEVNTVGTEITDGEGGQKV